MDSRMKNYKNKGKGETEMRGRRRDQNIELRKQKRGEQLLKKRQVNEEEIAQAENNSIAAENSSSTTTTTISRKTVHVSDLPDIKLGIYGMDYDTALEATARCRMLLSKERHPPIDDVIQHGLVERFVEFLSAEQYPRLQFEAAWTLTNIASGTSEQTHTVVNHGALPKFIAMLGSASEEVREQAVWALGNIAGDGPSLRDLCLHHGILAPLLQLLQSPQSSIAMVRNATWAVSNLCRGKNPQPNFDQVRHCIPILAHLILNCNDTEVLTDACWAVSYLTDGENFKIQKIIDAGIVGRLVQLLGHSSSAVQTPALRAVGNIVTGDDNQTQTVLDQDALGSFGHLMRAGKESLKKESCWTVSNITAGSKPQIQAVIDAGLIPLVLGCLTNGEFRTRKEACWAISNLTTGGTAKQINYVVHQGAIKPLVDMLEVQDAKIIQVAMDALTNIMRTGQQPDGSNPFADMVEECGGTEIIEHLQNHSSDDVYQKAQSIIETFFCGEEEEDLELAPETTVNGGFAFGAPVAPQHMALATVGGGFSF